MAEVLAGLELANLILSFVSFSNTVVDRLKTFHDQVDNVPEVFRTLKVKLPLTIDILDQTLAPAKAGNLRVETRQALTPVVEDCLFEVTFLDGRLRKMLPSHDDTGWDKTIKALKSLYGSRELQESADRLHGNMQLISVYQSTRAAGFGQLAAAANQPKKTPKQLPKPGQTTKTADQTQSIKTSPNHPPKPKQKSEEAVQVQSKSKASIQPLAPKTGSGGNETANKAPRISPQSINALPWTPIHGAAKTGDTDRVKVLIAEGADVNVAHRSGNTPLLAATRGNHFPTVSLLLDHGANINAADKKQDRPLTEAARIGNDAMVKLLLDRGARINPPGNIGRTALSNAARSGHYTTVELLLDRGAYIHVVNDDGWTPLHTAAGEGRKWTSKLLLERGADPDIKNDYGLTPLDVAARRGHDRVVQLLSRYETSASRPTLAKPKERWERLDKSPVRIVFRAAEEAK